MPTYSIYRELDGEITSIVCCPGDYIDMQLQMGEAYVDGAHDQRTEYVDVSNRSVKSKSPIPYIINKSILAANLSDKIVITGLPAEVQCYLSGPLSQSWKETDEQIELSVGLTGNYKLLLEAINMLPVEIEIVAT